RPKCPAITGALRFADPATAAEHPRYRPRPRRATVRAETTCRLLPGRAGPPPGPRDRAPGTRQPAQAGGDATLERRSEAAAEPDAAGDLDGDEAVEERGEDAGGDQRVV